MAQAAVYESSYAQFLEPPQPPKNVDLFTLFARSNGAVAAKWPSESTVNGISDGGSHVGLTQVMTDANQQSDPNAWNWATNAADGVGLFSGTPPSEYQTSQNKVQNATTYEGQIIAQHSGLVQLTGPQLENMALLLYGPFASTSLTMQYYIPNCTAMKKGKCTAWAWAVNSGAGGNPNGVNYANSIRAETVPQ